MIATIQMFISSLFPSQDVSVKYIFFAPGLCQKVPKNQPITFSQHIMTGDR